MLINWSWMLDDHVAVNDAVMLPRMDITTPNKQTYQRITIRRYDQRLDIKVSWLKVTWRQGICLDVKVIATYQRIMIWWYDSNRWTGAGVEGVRHRRCVSESLYIYHPTKNTFQISRRFPRVISTYRINVSICYMQQVDVSLRGKEFELEDKLSSLWVPLWHVAFQISYPKCPYDT